MKFAKRPNKAYSWAAFIIANVFVEIPYQLVLGVLAWASDYYPIYGANQSSQRQGLILLFVIQFFLFASTFGDLVIASLPDAETGGMMVYLYNTPRETHLIWLYHYRYHCDAYVRSRSHL